MLFANVELKERLDDLKQTNAELSERLSRVEKRLNETSAVNDKITIREICRVVERHMCLKAVGGNKRQARKEFFNFAQFVKESDQGKELQKLFEEMKFSETFIKRLKDDGNAATHDNRSHMTVGEVQQHLKKIVEDEDDEKEVLAFVSALTTFGLVDPDKKVNISNKAF